MKKIIFVIAVLVLFQYWDKVQNLFDSEADVVAAESEVILYGTSWCGYCKKTKALLDSEGVDYVEYDIETSEEGFRQHEALGGRGVPVLKVGETVIHGYSPERIRAALE